MARGNAEKNTVQRHAGTSKMRSTRWYVAPFPPAL